MIPRILEPEVMDTEAEAVEYNTMDHATVNRAFVDDLLRFASDTISGLGERSGPIRVLDVGTGTALIPLELCSRGKKWRVVGIDLAQAMLVQGSINIAAAGMANVIELRHVDAKRLPFEDGEFAVVMSNSIIHHIPEPSNCLEEMVRVVSRNGGLLFVRDLLRPDSEQQLDDLVDAHAGDATEHQRKMFAESLHAALMLDEIRNLAKSFGVEAGCIQQTTDRHWTMAWRRAD
jgi:ubiquinone/menaquinone biosynthesis C-methylase UbiE